MTGRKAFLMEIDPLEAYQARSGSTPLAPLGALPSRQAPLPPAPARSLLLPRPNCQLSAVGCQLSVGWATTSVLLDLIDLDTPYPLYCDVIRKRWAEFVHGEGCKWEKNTPNAWRKVAVDSLLPVR